jgi:hypothetical protein
VQLCDVLDVYPVVVVGSCIVQHDLSSWISFREGGVERKDHELVESSLFITGKHGREYNSVDTQMFRVSKYNDKGP